MLLVDGKKSCFVHYLCKAELSNIRSTADVQINIDISNLGGGGGFNKPRYPGGLRYPKWLSNFNSVMFLYQHVFKYRYKLNSSTTHKRIFNQLIKYF